MLFILDFCRKYLKKTIDKNDFFSIEEETEDSKNRINILIDSDVNSSINKLYKERHCKKQDLINQLLRFAVAEIDSLESSNK